MGHQYFIEDAIETKNIIYHNLGVLTFASNALLNTDQSPALFWITNPDNVVKGNHAAGATNYGFWYRAETRVTGVSAAQGMGNNVCPKETPLLEFADNVAHSCGRYGLRIYDEYWPRLHPCQPISASNPYVEAKYTNMFAYFNKKNGVQLSRLASVRLDHFKIADNGATGIECPGAQ